ncbi:hypothetical protein K9B35_12055 [Sphingomonas sp. R647]|uniref:hypothetical protein n=1 Tax=Sphingomonas sp. R647 TaxID=2875233 RepID=UPI001CD2D31F|nr:hypothetical protein [Sphingomonas sp. R647]MCA1198703.1 hypothetical protein [Sphingomonas sp. R647]
MRAALRLIAIALTVAALPVRGEDRPRPVTGSEMRAEARTLAGSDPRLLAEVEAAEAEASRGVLGAGPISIRHTVPGGASWSLPISRNADAAATIAVRRIGISPVALTILDSAGRQLCSDTSGGAVLACRIPAGGGPLIARVANRGTDATDVLLVTN